MPTWEDDLFDRLDDMKCIKELLAKPDSGISMRFVFNPTKPADGIYEVLDAQRVVFKSPILNNALKVYVFPDEAIKAFDAKHSPSYS